jgi:tetratricopeptide (TPR) repeat protein
LAIERITGELYSGEALKQDPQVKKLLAKARIELENGNLLQAKYYGRQAESLQPACTSVLSFMGELCEVSGEETLSAEYHARVMQLPKIDILNNKEHTNDNPQHIWLAAVLILFVIASAIAMMFAVNFKKTDDLNHLTRLNIIKTSLTLTEPTWIWQGATVFNVDKDRTVIPDSELTMKRASDAYNSGNYQRAAVVYTRLLKSKTIDPYIYQYLAYSYQRLGDSPHALQMLQTCMKKCDMNDKKDIQSIKRCRMAINLLLTSKK